MYHWMDDPRCQLFSGLRRKGITAEAIRKLYRTYWCCKTPETLLIFKLLGILHPVKLIIENYPEGQEEWVETENNPEDENAGTRQIPFSREIYIEREDFKEEANNKFFRLKLGGERKMKMSEITTIYATYDDKSKSGSGTEESLRKVKGTLHWVSAPHAIPVEARLYERLFTVEQPDAEKDADFLQYVNPESLNTAHGFAEPSLKDVEIGEPLQFQRIGYFTKRS
ncbi:hypothetical protein FQR65_LT15337 [Abscondita terminalis]|nr:hypothetical protein FQR65_LT15337 [Abscondita terminalis]